MTRRNTKVTLRNADNGTIPDFACPGVAMVLDLIQRNLLESIGTRIKIRREGGYCGFDILLFLLFYFAKEGIGMASFRRGWDRCRAQSSGDADIRSRQTGPL